MLYQFIGSGALSGKILFVRIINNKIEVYFRAGQAKKGQLCPAGLGKGFGQGPAGLEPPAGAGNRNEPSQIIFNNPRSSIKPEITPDPNYQLTKK